MRYMPKGERNVPDFFMGLSCTAQALIATLFTWAVTAAGAAVVFLVRRPRRVLMDGMLGFSAGVMLAASYWSLLAPAIELSGQIGMNAWLTPLAGLLAGGILVYAGDRIYDRLSLRKANQSIEKRCAMLMTSITLHNIPEGMAVGVAFGSLAYGLEGATLSAACMLALGIGLQNFPEGTAVSVPLLRENYTKKRAFLLGMLSGIVEPIAGVLGALLVLKVRPLLPFMLSFAAGAMLCVVTEELIPESQRNRHKEAMTFFTLAGFAVMMVLDVALG